MTKMIRIDSRVTGFSDEPVRLLAMCYEDTGEILLQKTEIFTALAVPPDLRKNTVVVTDSPNMIKNWQLKFDTQQHLEEVIRIYQTSYRGGLVEFENSIARYNPMNVLQVRKIDKKGMQQEFDSSSLNNGHIAALLAIWASHKIATGYGVMSNQVQNEDDIDPTMLPFSI